MKQFKFLGGDTSGEDFERLMDMLHEIDQLPVVGIDEIVGPPMIGLLHDYHENGLNLRGYEPYTHRHPNGGTYNSEIGNYSYNDWLELSVNQAGYIYILYAVYRPGDEQHEAEVVELSGAVNVHPLFVIDNPEESFLFEFIKIPTI